MRRREARIAEKLAMQITRGLEGLHYSWQGPFPATTPCLACGGMARIAFVAHEGMDGDEGPYLCEMRENGGEGDLWLHDCAAIAVYLCKDCLEPMALYNQA